MKYRRPVSDYKHGECAKPGTLFFEESVLRTIFWPTREEKITH